MQTARSTTSGATARRAAASARWSEGRAALLAAGAALAGDTALTALAALAAGAALAALAAGAALGALAAGAALAAAGAANAHASAIAAHNLFTVLPPVGSFRLGREAATYSVSCQFTGCSGEYEQ